MKLSCIIIDDEPLAAELIKKYVLQTPFLDLVGVYNNALDSLSDISDKKIDLAFLDINMPNINGLDFAKTLPKNIKVIFTTAYDQYAIESFKVNAINYLLKPISYNDFFEAANRALDWYKSIENYNADNNSIFVKSGYRIEKIAYDQILYIENQKDYVKFHIEDRDEPISSLMGIQLLADKLPESIFMRVHRSFIVNLEKIQTIERNCIVFGKIYIPISDTYKDKFQHFLNNKFI